MAFIFAFLSFETSFCSMNKLSALYILVFSLSLFTSCKHAKPDETRKPLLEVEGKFLYEDDIQHVIPPNVNKKDSAEIADSYIRKWVTDVLMYENAKRNITNQDEIDELVENYRRSLTIHQYQQKMIEQRVPKEATDEEMKAFYDQYSNELILDESIIKGLLLIVPQNAPRMSSVRSWVQSGNTKSLESIDKYSLQNAISYDYFGDKWVSFSEILKRMPLQIQDPSTFLANNHFVEISDSTQHYFLRIEDHKNSGQVEPYDMAKDKIANILLNKRKTDFITDFEKELYKDAVDNETVTFFKK